MTDGASLRQELEDHPYYRYRGCAPDPDDPGRMAGDLGLPLGAHHAPDVDGGESRAVRTAREEAAVKVCRSCPVVAQCDAYASGVDGDGLLVEPFGVWGGRTALERHRALVARQHGAGGEAETPQQLRVLRALAEHADPVGVAEVAGVDVRTANWQRRRLVTQLGLSRAVSRRELLSVAVERGLLEEVVVVWDDGSVPAVPVSSSRRSRSAGSGTGTAMASGMGPGSEAGASAGSPSRPTAEVPPGGLHPPRALAGAA